MLELIKQSVKTAAFYYKNLRDVINGKRGFETLSGRTVKTSSPSSINSDIFNAYKTVLAKARDLSNNTPEGTNFLGLARDNIFGSNDTGLQFKCRSAYDNDNKIIQDAWKDFHRKENFTMEGFFHGSQIYDLLNNHLMVDGEFIIRKVYDSSHKYVVKFEVLDPMLCPIDLNMRLDNGNTIVMGVELDKWGKRVANYFAPSIEMVRVHSYYSGYSLNNLSRIPSEQVIHVFRPRFAGQVRGISEMVSGLLKLYHMDKYLEAAIMNARFGASHMLFLTKKEVSAVDWRGVPTGDLPKEVKDNGDLNFEIEPGLVKELPRGFEPTKVEGNYPDGQLDDFTSFYQRQIATAWRVSYHKLANDLENINFSALRHGVEAEKDAWRKWQLLWRVGYFDDFYPEWLFLNLGSGTLGTGVRKLPMGRMEEYLKHSFTGRSWDYFDPSKDSIAFRNKLQTATALPSKYWEERGEDWEDIKDKWLEQMKFIAQVSDIFGDPYILQEIDDETTNTKD